MTNQATPQEPAESRPYTVLHSPTVPAMLGSCTVQVSTRHQLATGLVCAFPWLFRMSELVKAEAMRRSLPSHQEIIEDTSMSDQQHAANWAEVVLYLESITEHDLDVHVPFLRPEAHEVVCNDPRCSTCCST